MSCGFCDHQYFAFLLSFVIIINIIIIIMIITIVIPDIYPYGVGFLTLYIFVFLASFAALWWPNIWPKMGFRELLKKLLAQFSVFLKNFHMCSTRLQNRNLYWIFLDEVGSDQSGGILSTFMGTACYHHYHYHYCHCHHHNYYLYYQYHDYIFVMQSRYTWYNSIVIWEYTLYIRLYRVLLCRNLMTLVI